MHVEYNINHNIYSWNSTICKLFLDSKIIKNDLVVQEEMHCAVPNAPDGPKKVATGIQP